MNLARALRIPVQPPAVPRRVRWHAGHAVLAVLLPALAVAATWPTWADIVRIAARDEEQSHVFLVPPIVAWLVWVRRGRLRGYEPSGSWAGPVLIALGWALHDAGAAGLLESLRDLGAVAVLAGAIVTVVGAGALRRFLPAFVALAFLVPVPGTIRQAVALPLQQVSAAVTQTLLETAGTAVERSGNLLRVRGQEVAVAEACNGLRMVFALGLVTYLFAYGVPLRNGIRLLVMAASPVAAVAFNVLRLVPTVWAYGSFPGDAAASVHEVGGWFMPPCALLTLLALLRLLQWAQVPVAPYVLARGS